VEELQLGDEYGLVGDVMVNIFVSLGLKFFLSLGPVPLGYEGMELIPLPMRCTMRGSSTFPIYNIQCCARLRKF